MLEVMKHKKCQKITITTSIRVIRRTPKKISYQKSINSCCRFVSRSSKVENLSVKSKSSSSLKKPPLIVITTAPNVINSDDMDFVVNGYQQMDDNFLKPVASHNATRQPWMKTAGEGEVFSRKDVIILQRATTNDK
uniref:Uncharacterized protein n=1 Tax=Romanomermis culicivorax TaxID=13658 RepID=A0A915HGE8_ROMCU